MCRLFAESWAAPLSLATTNYSRTACILPLLRTGCGVAWKHSSVLGFPVRLLGQYEKCKHCQGTVGSVGAPSTEQFPSHCAQNAENDQGRVWPGVQPHTALQILAQLCEHSLVHSTAPRLSLQARPGQGSLCCLDAPSALKQAAKNFLAFSCQMYHD